MDVIPTVKGGSFDAEIIRTMGQVFDTACSSLRDFGSAVFVREIIAKRIIEAAKNGERDPARLFEQALRVVNIEIPRMSDVGSNSPPRPTPPSRTLRDVESPVALAGLYALLSLSANGTKRTCGPPHEMSALTASGGTAHSVADQLPNPLADHRIIQDIVPRQERLSQQPVYLWVAFLIPSREIAVRVRG